MPEIQQLDNHELQKVFLNENRLFLEAVRSKLPLEEILRQYDKVKSLFETIKENHVQLTTDFGH